MSTIITKFKDEYTVEYRKKEAERIIRKYADRIPVIVEIADSTLFNKNNITLDKKKFLVPHDLTVSQFLWVIRKRIKLSQEESIFLFVEDPSGGNILAPAGEMISSVYDKYKNEDNFLYFSLQRENAFG